MEPNLNQIGDYNTLKGEKKKVVWIVIATGVAVGILFSVVNALYGTPKDTIPIEKKAARMPLQ